MLEILNAAMLSMRPLRSKTLVLLMRYTGIRVSDATALTSDRLPDQKAVISYTEKTGVPVYMVIPDSLVEVFHATPKMTGNHYFWIGVEKRRTVVTHWQKRLKKHSRRPLGTFAVSKSDGQALQSPRLLDQIKVVFVTTDPERDTPMVPRTWLDHFDKRFIGLTGSQAAIDASQATAHLPVAKKTRVRPNGDYDVGHAAFVLAYTKDNRAHVIYPVGVREEDFAHDRPLETWLPR